LLAIQGSTVYCSESIYVAVLEQVKIEQKVTECICGMEMNVEETKVMRI
jgi:hypothetical protein